MLRTRGSVVRGCRVSVGTKWPLTRVRVTGRPKDGAFLAVGSPRVFHVQLCSRHYILTELTRASTSLPIDRARSDLGGTRLRPNVCKSKHRMGLNSALPLCWR